MLKRIAFICLAVALCSATVTAEENCSGCGCKGGPGYRGPPTTRHPKGECVGWAQLNKICGNPPTTHCTPEGPALIALGKAAATKALGFAGLAGGTDAALAPDEPKERGEAVTTNQLQTKSAAVACVALETLQAM